MIRIRLLWIFLASILVTVAITTSDHHHGEYSVNDTDSELVPLFSHKIRYLDSKYEFYGTYIGVILGQRHFRVAFENNGHIEYIPNELGNTKTPNSISFGNNGTILIGEAAESHANLSPQATVFDLNSLIRRKFNHPDSQREEIVAMFLKKMKDMAENHLRKRIRKVIITLPDYIVDYEWSFIMAVAEKVAFHITQVTSPHFAVLLAHNIVPLTCPYYEEGQKNYLVFDISEGACQVIIDSGYENGVFSSLDGMERDRVIDTNLGGKEFDKRVLNYFMGLIKDKYNKDILENKTTLERLVKECERAKIELSSHEQVVLEVESLFEGVNFSEPLTRTKFEELNADLFEKATALVESALAKMGLKKEDINETFLLGKSSQIPKVQKLFKDFFDGKESNNAGGINPDEVLLKGALRFPQYVRCIHRFEVMLMAVAPLGFGIQTVDGVMTKVIQRYSILPMTRKEVFTTNKDNQSTVEIKVFTGEKRLANGCHEIGRFNLTGIVPSPRGVPRIEVSFQVSEDGIVRVKATEKVSNVSALSKPMISFMNEDRQRMMVEESVEEEDKMYWLKEQIPSLFYRNFPRKPNSLVANVFEQEYVNY